MPRTVFFEARFASNLDCVLVIVHGALLQSINNTIALLLSQKEDFFEFSYFGRQHC